MLGKWLTLCALTHISPLHSLPLFLRVFVSAYISVSVPLVFIPNFWATHRIVHFIGKCSLISAILSLALETREVRHSQRHMKAARQTTRRL